MAYELTTGFHTDSWEGIPEYVSYTFRPNMQADDIDSWDDALNEDEKIIKELLQKLVYGSGSWSNNFLYKYRHEPLKHFQDSSKKWVKRVKRVLFI